MLHFKKVSKSGNISIPAALRRERGIQIGDSFEVEMQEGGNILLKRHTAHCMFCENTEGVVMFKGKPLCKSCISEMELINK